MQSEACRCQTCTAKKELPQKYKVLADHLGLWSKFSDHVIAIVEQNGPIKNEEYACLDDSLIHIETLGSINCETEHHEPWKRDYSIT
jgi:hypothetical protein